MISPLRLGAHIPNSGPLPEQIGIAAMAKRLEDAGFDSLWCSDHILMPAQTHSPYPYADDKAPTWSMETPWYDAIVAMTLMASATSRVEIGVAVLVLPLRHPLILAKQIASLDRLCGNRVVLGVGAGWLAEEFLALGVPYATRGPRLDEGVELLRLAWTGSIEPTLGDHYRLPEHVLLRPTPVSPPPILIGGSSRAALRRAASSGDGWLPLQRADRLDVARLRSDVSWLRSRSSATSGHDGPLRVTLRIVGAAGMHPMIASTVPDLVAAGVDEIVIDTSWIDGGNAEQVCDSIRTAIERG